MCAAGKRPVGNDVSGMGIDVDGNEARPLHDAWNAAPIVQGSCPFCFEQDAFVSKLRSVVGQQRAISTERNDDGGEGELSRKDKGIHQDEDENAQRTGVGELTGEKDGHRERNQLQTRHRQLMEDIPQEIVSASEAIVNAKDFSCRRAMRLHVRQWRSERIGGGVRHGCNVDG